MLFHFGYDIFDEIFSACFVGGLIIFLKLKWVFFHLIGNVVWQDKLTPARALLKLSTPAEDKPELVTENSNNVLIDGML